MKSLALLMLLLLATHGEAVTISVLAESGRQGVNHFFSDWGTPKVAGDTITLPAREGYYGHVTTSYHSETVPTEPDAAAIMLKIDPPPGQSVITVHGGDWSEGDEQRLIVQSGSTVINEVWSVPTDGWYTHSVNLDVQDVPGDYNHDGVVNAADYTVWRNAGGSVSDWQLWADHYGEPQLLILLTTKAGTPIANGLRHSVVRFLTIEPVPAPVPSLDNFGVGLLIGISTALARRPR